LVGHSFYSLDELIVFKFTKGCVTYSVYIDCKRPVLNPLEYNNKSNQSNQIYVTLLFRANVFIVLKKNCALRKISQFFQNLSG